MPFPQLGSEARFLCVSLHDVAPPTLPACIDAVAFLDAQRIGPIALLIVPDYHGHGRVDRDARFHAFIESRILQGDEIVLHGWRHLDEVPSRMRPDEWLLRRLGAERGGEFSRLDLDSARVRLLRGLAILRSAGWYPDGFVAPTWVMSDGTLTALEDLQLQYCSTRDHIIDLRSGERWLAPSLVMSPHAEWRRMVSPLWNRLLLRRFARHPVLRLALRPADVRIPALAASWQDLFSQLAERRFVTEGALVAARRPRSAPASAATRNERKASRRSRTNRRA
jgi:predicted deacetylase